MTDNKKEKQEEEIVKFNLGKLPTHKWALSSYALGILSIILIIVLVTGGSLGGVSKSKMKALSENFINTELIPGENAQVESIEIKNGIYVATVNVQGDNVPVYFTKNGQFISQGSELIPIDGSVPSNTETEKVEVSEDDDASIGLPNAPVTIIEFSDYQCPFCRKFWTETYPQLKSQYIDTGKVRLVFRDFPLNFHPQAQVSAEAAECVREVAGNDEAYFKFHDKLFSEQNILDGGTVKSTVSYTEADLKKWAKDLGYDIGSCLDSGKYASEVQKDLADGQAYGISGTPGLFINGVQLDGAQPFSNFKSIIDAELA